MKINGIPTRTIRPAADGATVEIIDQTRLPHVLIFEAVDARGCRHGDQGHEGSRCAPDRRDRRLRNGVGVGFRCFGCAHC